MSAATDEFERSVAGYFLWEEGPGHKALESIACGPGPGEEPGDVDAHLGACETCRDVLAACDAVDDIWREDEAVGPAAPEGRRQSPRWERWALVPAAVAAVVLLAVYWWPASNQGTDFPLIPKGGVRLHVAADRGGKGFVVKPGERLQTGDRIGLFYSADASGYLIVLYGDQRGDFVQICPARGRRAIQAQTGSEVRLTDGAWISPGEGCEWFVAFFSPRPFSVEAATGAAQRMWQGRRGCDLGASDLADAEVEVIGVRR